MRTLTVHPERGGRLASALSATEVRLHNYLAKVNLRRDGSDEAIREGHDYWIPFPEAEDNEEQHIVAATLELNLICYFRRPNGDIAVIAGGQGYLYRFNAGLYGYDAGEYDADEYARNPSRWELIASGLNSNASRWEMAQENGTAILSNGFDCVVYRVEWDQVRPNYELRDIGVIGVKTVTQSNGMVVYGGITEVGDQSADDLLNILDSGTVTVSQAGYTSHRGASSGTGVSQTGGPSLSGDAGKIIVWEDGVRELIDSVVSSNNASTSPLEGYAGRVVTDMRFIVTTAVDATIPNAFTLIASDDFFTEDMVGQRIAWADGTTRTVWKVNSPTSAQTDSDAPVSSGSVKYHNPDSYLGRNQLSVVSVDERPNRVIWSELKKPSSFEAAWEAEANTVSRYLTLTRPTPSISQGDRILVAGGGLNGGTMGLTTADAVYVEDVGPGFIKLSRFPLTTGSVAVVLYGSYGSTAGHEDLSGDGSLVLKMLELQQQLVVYQDGEMHVMSFTGVPASPWRFRRITVDAGAVLHYRHTLVPLDANAHAYAGKSNFWTFKLTTMTPALLPQLEICKDIFFDHAKIADTESIFGSVNALTREVWFCINANEAPYVLALDTITGTASQIDYTPSCAGTIKSPSDPVSSETGDLFLMGTHDGIILLYGLTSEDVPQWNGKTIFTRRDDVEFVDDGTVYDCVLKSGYEAFEMPHQFKYITGYLLQMSSYRSSSNPSADVVLRGYHNEGSGHDEIASFTMGGTDEIGSVALTGLTYMVQDVVTVASDSGARIHGRGVRFNPVEDQSTARR